MWIVLTYSLDSWGESDLPACGPPASFSDHLYSSSVTPAGFVHKSRGDNMVRQWVQLKRGQSSDGCDLVDGLCVSMIEEGWFICSELGKGATIEAEMYLLWAANV